MKKIFKYPLRAEGQQTITMPKGGEILSVQFQNGAICVWALVNPDAEPEGRVIDIFGTGHPVLPVDALGATRKHLGTVQDAGLVWHVFEVIFKD